jgi:hypothetical protein
MTFEISERERDVLVELLSAHVKAMLIEIRHTDTRVYREVLQAKETVAESLLAKLQAGQ